MFFCGYVLFIYKNNSTYSTQCGIAKIEKETEENNIIALKNKTGRRNENDKTEIKKLIEIAKKNHLISEEREDLNVWIIEGKYLKRLRNLAREYLKLPPEG